MNDSFLWFFIIFGPSIGALWLAIWNSKSEASMRTFANAVTLAVFVLTLFALYKFDSSTADMQMVVKVPWISSWNVNYQLGVDGISMPLVVLTSFVSWLAM